MNDKEFNHIEYKKPIFDLSAGFVDHLKKYSRYTKIPIAYHDLLRYQDAIPLMDDNGENTLWKSVNYSPSEYDHIVKCLVRIYQMLNADGRQIDYLKVGSIDFCSYGNSQPFRVKIVNEINDNHDYFYI